MRSPMLLVLMALACSGGKDEAAESGGGESSSPGDTSEGGDDTGAATLCPEDVDLFEERVWDPVLSTYCLGCHNSDGPASGTRMVFRRTTCSQPASRRGRRGPALGEAHWTSRGWACRRWLVLPDTDAWAALEFWVDWTNGVCAEEDEGCEDGPLPRRLRRLDHSEYQRTIEDLLGITTDHAETLAPDVAVDGFPNDVDALLVSGLLADQYRAAAEDLASVADVSMLTASLRRVR